MLRLLLENDGAPMRYPEQLRDAVDLGQLNVLAYLVEEARVVRAPEHLDLALKRAHSRARSRPRAGAREDEGLVAYLLAAQRRVVRVPAAGDGPGADADG